MANTSSACIVVGGCGFVGSALVPKLAAQGLDIVVIDQNLLPQPCPSARYVQADIRDRDALMHVRNRCPRNAYIINLAARQYQDEVPKIDRQNWFSRVNVSGAMNICQFAEELHPAGLIFFSTDMVYGMPTSIPIPGNHALNPVGPYGRSKMQMEWKVGQFAHERGLPLTVFRPRLIAGRGRLGVLTKLFRLIRRNLPIPLLGNGRNHYQMVSVDDCASAVLTAIARGCPHGAYNLGSKPALTVRELLRALIDAVHSRSMVVPVPAFIARSGIRLMAMLGTELLYPEQLHFADKDFIVDTGKAQDELDWQPQVDDLDMMVEAYDFWNSLN